MPRFEGCVEAKEISLCPVKRGGGANQHAHVLVRKNADPSGGPQHKPENKTMPAALTDAEKAATIAARDLEVSKIALAQTNKVVAMSDVTKAYYLALDETAQLAFLEKSAEDMATEAKTAAEAVEKKRLEDEAAKSGKTIEVVALEKRLTDQDEIIKGLQAGQAESAIEKRADTEFAGYPGGSAKVIPLLKAYAKLSEEDRKASEAVLKAQCKTGAAAMLTFAGRTEADMNKAASAQQRIDAGVEKMMKDNPGMTKGNAFIAVTELAEFAEDVKIIG